MKDLRNISLFFSMLAAGLAACDPAPEAGVDGGGDPEPTCPTYYPDLDRDGYGDKNSLGFVTCNQPTNTVANKTDCNDGSAFQRPGHPELCDTFDNDCDGTADDSCVDGCTAFSPAGGSTYLFCTPPQTRAAARTICVNQGMDLLKVKTTAEHELLKQRTPAATKFWIGATDSATEGTWVWGTETAAFWMGGSPASGGAPVNGAFTAWAPGNPGPDDCAILETDSDTWYAADCAGTGGFICERE